MPEMAENDVLQKKKSHRDRHSGIWPYSFPITLFAYINLCFFSMWEVVVVWSSNSSSMESSATCLNWV
jgi:hypothetical protein